MIPEITCIISLIWTGSTSSLTIEEIYGRPDIIGHRPSKASLSPDVTKLAYVWAEDKAEPLQLWIVPTSSGAPLKLTSLEKGVSGTPQWSKDGTSLLIQTSGDLYLVTVDEGSLQQCTKTGNISSDYQWTSDGMQIVFTADGNLWTVPIHDDEPVQLTTEGDISAFKCAPTGNRIAFTRKLEERKIGLYAVDINTKNVTEVNTAEFILQWCWSPEGNKIAFYTINREEVMPVIVPNYSGDFLTTKTEYYLPKVRPQRSIGVANLNDGSIIHLAPQSDRECLSVYYLRNLEWSPDGRALLIRGNSHDCKEANVYVAKASNWQMRLLYNYRNEKFALSDKNAFWSLDGQSVLFTSQEDGWNHLYSVPADGGETKQLTKGKWEVAWAVRPKDSEKIIYTSTEVHTSQRHFYILSPDTGESFQLQTPRGVNSVIDIAKDGSLIIFTHEDFFLPPELWGIVAQENAKPIRYTHTISERFSEINWIKPRIVHFDSHVDGKKLVAMLYEPREIKSGQRYPAVIYAHGGPVQGVLRSFTLYYRHRLFAHRLAEKGYIVLDLDYRGVEGYGQNFQTGYGRDFQTDVYGDYYALRAQDILSGAHYLRGLEYVRNDRIGILGVSFGGPLALVALSLVPDMFACGVLIKAAYLWERKPFYPGEVHQWLGSYEDNPEGWKNTNVVNHAENLKAPLLILHGMKDTAAPFIGVAHLIERLVQLGKDFEMAIYPSQGHGYSEPQYGIDELRRVERFLEQHLQE